MDVQIRSKMMCKNNRKVWSPRWSRRQVSKCWYTAKCLPCVKARYVLTVMLSLGICIADALRVILSVAIVQMTAKNPHNTNQRNFHWSSSEQAMNVMFGKWAPPLERSMMATVAFAGSYAGNIVAFPLSGLLCNTMGWPWAFYISGIVGIIWFVAWLFLVFNTPADHPRISPEEHHYIESSIDSELLLQESVKEDFPPPWSAIFTSPAVLAIIIGHFANNWGFYTLLTCLPTFLSQTLCLDINKNGFYSAIPYTCLALMAVTWGQVTDLLRQHKLVTTTAIRKLNSVLGLCIPAMFLLLCSFYGNTAGWAITFLTLSVGCTCFGVAGYHVNYLDISPKYAGILMGISNTIATIPGFVGPQVAKAIAKGPNFETCDDSCNDPTSIDVYRQEWTLVFIIAAEAYVFGAIAYLLLGSGEKQWWADGVKHNKEDVQTPLSSLHLQTEL
ncbi:sialin-like isoform X2 [Dysidea avara]|uniref:sialin-like isoform X2 n=1 Tax=Dysidea avara TaxID=196820 RepID=UPI00331A22C7